MTSKTTTKNDQEALERFRRRVSAVGGLPTLPKVAAEVLRLAHDPDSSLKDMAAVISKDPPLTSRLLKVANSAFYGLSQQVGSLSVALVLLGMRNITNIVTSISVFRMLRFRGKAGAFTREAFWEHAGACGKACDLIGRVCRLDLGGEAFVTGLIHDVGKILMDAVFHEEFVRILELAAAEGIPMYEAETRILGVDHARIGAWLAEVWNLPEHISEALAHHHGPPCDPAEKPLAASLQLADAIVRIERLGFTGFSPPPTYEELSNWPLAKAASLNWKKLAEQLHNEFDNVQAFIEAASG